MKRAFLYLGILVIGLSLAGCTTPASRTSTTATFNWTSPTKRIVLVEPDIQLAELDAGGIAEPRADWTETAREIIEKGVRAHFGKSGAEVVNAQSASAREIQLIKLHGAVGQAIMIHAPDDQANVNFTLPNKGDALDWTLGPGTNEMRERYGADYALFVYLRDSYSSTAKKALDVLTVIAGAALGVGIVPAGGVQIGFASLVDLRTGDIVWFNRPVNTLGDLREQTDDERAATELLKDIPI